MYMAKFYLNKINFIIFVAIAMAMAVKERKFISASTRQRNAEAVTNTHTNTYFHIYTCIYTSTFIYNYIVAL